MVEILIESRNPKWFCSLNAVFRHTVCSLYWPTYSEKFASMFTIKLVTTYFFSCTCKEPLYGLYCYMHMHPVEGNSTGHPQKDISEGLAIMGWFSELLRLTVTTGSQNETENNHNCGNSILSWLPCHGHWK